MVSGVNNAKSSVQKGIRASILENYPYIENYLDQIIPKKGDLKIVKCHEHIEILANASGEPILLFYLFVLSGANIMCPGLTSPGAKMTKVDADKVVCIMAEGKQNALAIGYTKMSTEEILSKNKGIGVDNIHYLNDGLWNMKSVK
ncbi:hypothetical protein KUTeg_024945 [Tegillarca granosa]|uniref:PUA domain-containing protein n=1 Tax=Tegillarca granosa TaxID=220873 RepID=A0ABQ9DYP2_TEGGR|nr:hypothetical protein KUTeg_024945 [Tegillarca granosa]